MKRIAAIVLLAMLIGGCSGVILNPEYSAQLDRTVVWSAKASEMAQADELTGEQMKQVISQEAEMWRLFQAGRDGRASK